MDVDIHIFGMSQDGDSCDLDFRSLSHSSSCITYGCEVARSSYCFQRTEGIYFSVRTS